MKAVLKFELPEENLRQELKHGEHDGVYNEALEYVRRVIVNECLNRDLNLLD